MEQLGEWGIYRTVLRGSRERNVTMEYRSYVTGGVRGNNEQGICPICNKGEI
jgi:hypothetical protein